MEPRREGFVGRIPVRNIWLLMLYASDQYRVLDHGKYLVEDNPDEIPDLVAELLSNTVERRLMRNLSAGYRIKKTVQGRVRGRIDFMQTESHLLLERGKIACRYEELTVDTPRNRYVRGALQCLSKIVHTVDLRKKCSSLSARLWEAGVTGSIPDRSMISCETFGRNDQADRKMISLARLAFDLSLPTEEAGRMVMNSPARDEQWIRKLFEKAVGGFYYHVLDYSQWKVTTGSWIHWPTLRKTANIDSILPSMKTDIILERTDLSQRIVIDTKFTDIVCTGWYREESLKSGYLYQIYTYLRTQEKEAALLSLHSTGLLLHPAIGSDYDEAMLLDGHCIRFMTIDLAGSSAEIRKGLLRVLEQPLS